MPLSLSVSELIKRIPKLKAGTKILLSGTLYTARDAAHQRLAELIGKGARLPFELQDSIIYYCGPCPAKPGSVIGSCGPTTSSRMDAFTPLLLSKGVKATIGKGKRSDEVKENLKACQALYLVATGGVAALLSKKVKKADVIAFADLGPEAVYRLEVTDFPVTVAYDTEGGDIFSRGT